MSVEFSSIVCGKPLAWAVCSMVVHSFCLYSGVRGYLCILVKINQKAANFCTYGLLDVK